MTKIKITTDASVKYVSKDNNSPSEKSHDHKPKTISNPRNQNEKFSKKNEKFNKKIIAKAFGLLK